MCFHIKKQWTKEWCVIGHFGIGLSLTNGQTIKTKVFYDALSERVGSQNVCYYDTHRKMTIFYLPILIFCALWKSKNIVVLPAHNGIRLIVPLLVIENGLFDRKLYYNVIGGWLSHFITRRKFLKRQLNKLEGIFVETSTMKVELLSQGIQNIKIMQNFKKLRILPKDQVVYMKNEPYKICTFSRVSKEKGIEDAVNAIIEVNNQFKREIFQLDIFGPVDQYQKEWFSRLQALFPPSISYCGVIPFDKSSETLVQYFALLFPTRYSTEGIPGTIIDAYSAGVPVIASNWNSVSDIIDDGKTGLIFPMCDVEALKTILIKIFQNPYIINKMKYNCLVKAIQYTPENALKILIAD